MFIFVTQVRSRQDAVVVLWAFANDYSPEMIKGITPGRALTDKTITQWIVYCREVCMVWDLRCRPPEDRMVGGVRADGTPIIVQVDEVLLYLYLYICIVLFLFTNRPTFTRTSTTKGVDLHRANSGCSAQLTKMARLRFRWSAIGPARHWANRLSIASSLALKFAGNCINPFCFIYWS